MLLFSVWKLLLCTSVCKYICTVTKHEPPIREPFPVTQWEHLSLQQRGPLYSLMQHAARVIY